MTPTVVSEPRALFDLCEQARRRGERVGFVPTMGALHAGHLSLVSRVLDRSNFTVVSIFVNPTQFGPNEDLDRYPRTWDADLEKLTAAGVNAVFAPSKAEMYPDGFATEISVYGVSEGMCGDARPGHFDGVALVVTKLLSAVGACVAAFGRKDYQQLQVIKRMTADLNLPVDIIEGPTFREPDGLAMSSRNAYLSKEKRAAARAIPEGLCAAHAKFSQGERAVSRLISAVTEKIAAAADSVDYITAADPVTLRAFPPDATPAKLLIAVAARFGETRLIDNIVLGEDAAPIG